LSSLSTLSSSSNAAATTTINNQKEDGQQQSNYPTNGIPQLAECEVKFTNNRVVTFAVQHSAPPTRQILTVRANGRIAKMSDFVIPHRDGLSTCRFYDATHTVDPSSYDGHDNGAPPLDVFTMGRSRYAIWTAPRCYHAEIIL
jgi:hypothetical protein